MICIFNAASLTQVSYRVRLCLLLPLVLFKKGRVKEATPVEENVSIPTKEVRIDVMIVVVVIIGDGGGVVMMAVVYA